MNHAGDRTRAEAASDIQRESWIDRSLPSAARPYARLMRLDRPIGTWLLLFPCWWGIVLAKIATGEPLGSWADIPLFLLFLLFAVGAVVMRGAGCTYNDIVDRDIDAKVARTALRPIPSGQVSVRHAIFFLAAQLLIGFAILLTFNRFTIILGIASLALVFTYPFMKRLTFWPQAFLGLTFNWGALMGWAAVTGNVGWPAIALYAGGIAWTLHYDTIYAHQDKEDDSLIGVKSTALKLGASTRPWLAVFSAITVVLFGTAVALATQNWNTFAVVVLPAGHLVWQVRHVDFDSPRDCLIKFQSNMRVGVLMLLCLVVLLSPDP